jgi:hypothetical protein
LFEASILEADWQWWLFAGLAFIYGLAIMLVVIVTLSKSARQPGENKDKEN